MLVFLDGRQHRRHSHCLRSGLDSGEGAGLIGLGLAISGGGTAGWLGAANHRWLLDVWPAPLSAVPSVDRSAGTFSKSSPSGTTE